MNITGLKSIILHDSYFKGKRTKIHCQGHTNNTGDNGMGKTSALTLIPVFYGYEPERLISRSGNKKSFVDYYLPHPQSLIIFEYSRHDGDRCVCLYRKNQGGLAYRFIKGSADDTIFSPELADAFANKLAISDLLKNKLPFETSNQIDTITDYRAIIQNNVKVLKKRSKGRQSFVGETYNYSLSTKSINHIGALTSVVLKHDRLLAQFKTMLVDSFLRDHISLESKPLDNKGRELIDDLRSVNSFDIKTSELTESYQSCLQLLSDWQNIEQTYTYSENYQQGIIEHKQQLTDHLQQQQTAKQNEENSLNEELRQWQEETEKLKISLQSYQKNLQDLDQQKHKWQTQDIDNKRRQVDNIEDYQTRISEQEAQYSNLQQDAQSIKDEHQKRLRELTESLSQKLKQFTEQRDELREKYQQDIELVQQRHQQQKEKDEQKRRQLQQRQNQAYNQLKETQQPILIEIGVLKHSGDAHSQQQQAQLQSQLDQAYGKLANLDEKQTSIQQQLNQTNQQFGLSQNQLNSLNTEMNGLKAKAEQLHRILYPAKNSLLETLMQHPKHAQKSILKVVNPELLHRQDREPSWHQAFISSIDPNNHSDSLRTADSLDLTGDSLELLANSNFYGLDIDLDKIETPESAITSYELNQKYESVNQQIKQKQQLIDTTAKTLEQYRQQLRELEAQLKLTANHKQTHNLEIGSIKDKQAQLKQQIKQKQQQQIEQKQAELSAIEQKLKQLQSAQSVEASELEQEIAKRSQGFIAQIKDIEQQRDNELKAIKEQINQAETDKQTDEKRYQQRYHNALADKGVDTDQLNELSDSIAKLKRLLQQAESYQKLIAEYQRWLREEYSNHELYQSKVYQLQDDLTANNQKIKELVSLKEQRLQAYDNQLSAISTKLNNLATQSQSIEQWQNKAKYSRHYLSEFQQTQAYQRLRNSIKAIEDTDQPDTDKQITDQQITAGQVKQPIEVSTDSTELPWLTKAILLIENTDKQLRVLTISAQNLTQAVTTHSESKIYQHWLSRKSEYQDKVIVDSETSMNKSLSPEVRYMLDLVSLYSLMTEDLSQLKRSIRSQFVSTGLHFSNYYQTLSELNTKVKTIGSNLAKQINTDHHFPALSDIHIELISKIHDYEMWSDLKSFEESYRTWTHGPNDSLPNEDFILSFERLLTSLESTQINEDIESLVELKISLTENGRVVPIKTDQDLQDASSTGLSLLAVIVVFCGMTRYLCPDESVTIHWPLDEIGQLSNQNTKLLFELMQKRNVTLFCAQPDASPLLNQFFVNKNWLDLRAGVRTIEVLQHSHSNPLLRAKTNPANENTPNIKAEQNA